MNTRAPNSSQAQLLSNFVLGRMLKMKQLTAVCAIAVSIAASGIASAAAGDGVSVFATGFNSPRGVTFGPDDNLYVAEAGLGGTRSTIGQCTQVPGAPGGPGPYTIILDADDNDAKLVRNVINSIETVTKDRIKCELRVSKGQGQTRILIGQKDTGQ